mgnify:CR=1 FL=1
MSITSALVLYVVLWFLTFLIVIVVFFLIRAIPGEPCTAILGEQAT